VWFMFVAMSMFGEVMMEGMWYMPAMAAVEWRPVSKRLRKQMRFAHERGRWVDSAAAEVDCRSQRRLRAVIA